MSRIAVSLFGLVCLAVTPALAQRRELTAFAGGTLSGATGNYLASVEKRPGFALGLGLRIPRSPRFSFETQLLVVQHRLLGQRAGSTNPPLQTGPLADAANLLYVEIPVLLRLQQGYSTVRPVRPYLVLGPYFGIRLDCRRELTESNGNQHQTDCTVAAGSFTPGSETYLPALYQEVDVGLLAGIGAEFRQFAIGARFERSFRNLVEPSGLLHTSPFDSSRLWSALVSVEYVIRVL
jgi:outer membrane protein with beta-barrel domain